MGTAGGIEAGLGVADTAAQPKVPVPHPDALWRIELDDADPDRLRVNGSLLCLADGIIGVSGAPLAFHPSLYRSVVASGVYSGDGPETHLLTAPIAMQLPYQMAVPLSGRWILDLYQGVVFEETETSQGTILAARFSSVAQPGVAAFRALCPDGTVPTEPLLGPVDDRPLDSGTIGGATWMRVLGNPGGIAVAAIDHTYASGDRLMVDRVSVYEASGTDLPPVGGVVDRSRAAATTGYDALLAEHADAWARRWEAADIVIEGDNELQRAIRFSLFHLMASVRDDGDAAVGARGLTGTSYRGHVFWDADTFTLPFLAATHERSARAMLEYRIRRLPAARAAARDAGRRGARFPWESARTGEDVTPVSARDRTGRTVAILTGQLEEHIVAQVAWAASCYVDWSGDTEFARGPGLGLLVETARYWASRVGEETDGAHIRGVIGPDEYHESVDDNAFTNVMARWNLRCAADAVLEWEPTPEMTTEAAHWRNIADRMVDGFDPVTGVYEQFAGFHDLEPLIIAEIAPRRPIAADLLLGANRVSGAQVLKQADVLMLHHLVPDEVAAGSLEANLAFYEPRTAHGSSLSPGVHASLFARAGQFDRAINALRMACRMDLDDLTASTSGGLHLATMGTVWQALVFGFVGLRPHAGRLVVHPRLPPSWPSIEVRARYRGRRVHVLVEHGRVVIDSDGPVPLTVDGVDYEGGSVPLTIPLRVDISEVNP